jgi:hypothetical protein
MGEGLIVVHACIYANQRKSAENMAKNTGCPNQFSDHTVIHTYYTLWRTEMSALAQLKLIAAKRPVQLSPVVQRRNKVVKRIWEQIQLATAAQEGKTYAPTKKRLVKNDETGESTTISVPKRIKEWWFVTDAGKLCVQLRYGAKVVEIAKGKGAIELAHANDLVPTLNILKAAVEGGELDAQLEAVSGVVKAAFKK